LILAARRYEADRVILACRETLLRAASDLFLKHLEANVYGKNVSRRTGIGLRDKRFIDIILAGNGKMQVQCLEIDIQF